MKKISIMLLALLPAMVGWSQDTVQSPLRDNYFLNAKPNIEGYWLWGWAPQWGDGCGITTKEMTTADKDSITIYGMAACLMTDYDEEVYLEGGIYTEEEWWANFWAQFRDTTFDECYEYLGIYLASGDSLVPQREVMVHREYDTVAYYVEMNRYFGPSVVSTYPMYEKYFDSSITVGGTFYVGTTQRSLLNTIGRQVIDHMGFALKCLSSTGLHEYHVSKYCWPDEGRVFWNWPLRQSNDGDYYLIFPILTPDPSNPVDTVGGNPGDTVGVAQADLLNRYVSVQPNPAVEEATVLSSFGLTRIEAYDPNGHRVADLPATGLQATLDVASWPAATYLLRITTPMGTVTKKLIVR